MSSIKVKINPPLPSREVINKYKNFGRFMDSYRKYYSPSGFRYMMKFERRKLIYIVLIIILILLLLFANEEVAGAGMPGIISKIKDFNSGFLI